MKDTKKIAVFTCVAGGYDHIESSCVGEDGVDFICFTDGSDRHLASPWQHERFKVPLRMIDGHDINRFHKIFPHRILAQYDYSIYIDGNVSYVGSFRKLVEALRENKLALAAFSHHMDRTVEQEMAACNSDGKLDDYDQALSDKQLSNYRGNGFDTKALITENCLLVRDHTHSELDTAMSIWWSHLFEFTKRDQISLQYACWKANLPWAFLDLSLGFDVSDMSRRKHRKPPLKKLKKEIMRPLKQVCSLLRKFR